MKRTMIDNLQEHNYVSPMVWTPTTTSEGSNTCPDNSDARSGEYPSITIHRLSLSPFVVGEVKCGSGSVRACTGADTRGRCRPEALHSLSGRTSRGESSREIGKIFGKRKYGVTKKQRRGMHCLQRRNIFQKTRSHSRKCAGNVYMLLDILPPT